MEHFSWWAEAEDVLQEPLLSARSVSDASDMKVTSPMLSNLKF